MPSPFAALETMVVPEKLEERGKPIGQRAMQLKVWTQPGMEGLSQGRRAMEASESIPKGLGKGMQGWGEELRNRKLMLVSLSPASNDG